jgi:hypothetical protein
MTRQTNHAQVTSQAASSRRAAGLSAAKKKSTKDWPVVRHSDVVKASGGFASQLETGRDSFLASRRSLRGII